MVAPAAGWDPALLYGSTATVSASRGYRTPQAEDSVATGALHICRALINWMFQHQRLPTNY